ncbi:MAG: hypothetical protein LBM96_10780 [Methanobrevibacter sp.]|nr:hypothetical protein [Candidatus Methanoflexus mossambicus]
MRGRRIAYKQKILKRCHPTGNYYYVESGKKKIYTAKLAPYLKHSLNILGRYCNVDLSYEVTELESYHEAYIVEVF